MAAERCNPRCDPRQVLAGVVIVAAALMTSAPARCDPAAAAANVIVDLSVIDSLGAVPQPDAPEPTAAVRGRTADLLQPGRAAPTPRLPIGAGPAVVGSNRSGHDHGRLIPDRRSRMAAEIRERMVAPVPLPTRPAAYLLASVEPPPRTPVTSTPAPIPADGARLYPPPEILSPSAPSDRPPAGTTDGTSQGTTEGTGSPAQNRAMFPPPGPAKAVVPEPESRAGGSGVLVATAWPPAPARKPADGPQGALLSPALPPAKPNEEAPPPTRKPGPSALEDQRASADYRLQLIYATNAIEIPTRARPQLEGLARDVKAAGKLRIRLNAYAGNSDSSASRARRTSLSRALAVRSFLIDRGIAAGRIDVRALGNTSTADEADRVDVVVLDK